MKTASLVGLMLVGMPLWAAEKEGALEAQPRVHRLTSAKRAPFDAFVYANRIPESPGPSESSTDFAGRIFGRLANQEGRVLLKLPPGMDGQAYFGFKKFLGSEGDRQTGNCVTCHTSAEFADGKRHVVTKGGPAVATASLRNLKARKVDVEKVVKAKLAASRLKKSGQAEEIDDAYGRINLSEADIPDLVAFMNSLEDVADAEFRNLILDARVFDASTDGATHSGIAGVVRYEGPDPIRNPLPMTPESAGLYETVPFDERLLVGNNGGLANAFVYVRRGVEKKEYPVPAEPALLDQDRSIFRPRIQGVRVGQEFLTQNSDPFIHNVRSLSLKNRAFNVAQPPKTPNRSRVFTRAEGPIRLGCDFHPWMKAFVFVMDHPFFAVTDVNGRFQFEGLPPGDYTLAAWHEEFGEQRVQIKVGDSEPAESDFVFKPK